MTVGRRMILAEARGRANWLRSPSDRAWIAARYHFPLRGTPHEARLRRVALRHYGLTQRCLTLEADPAGRRAVTAPAAPEGPVIYAFAHSPGMWLGMYGLVNAGVRAHPVVEPWFWDDRRTQLRVDELARTGGGVVDAAGSFAQLVAILADGGSPCIAVDMPGAAPATFLGKPAGLRTGFARLALATGARILPAWGGFRATRPMTIASAPVMPEGEPADLMARVVDVLDQDLRGRPDRWMPWTADIWPGGAAHRAAYD